MNETERVIELTGYSKQVPITWHEDPTRHLLKENAVNARSKSDSGNQSTRMTGSSKPKANNEEETD